jgi:hypothetical protein
LGREVLICSLTERQIKEKIGDDRLANERIPERVVPLMSYVQNLSERRFAVQVD